MYTRRNGMAAYLPQGFAQPQVLMNPNASAVVRVPRGFAGYLPQGFAQPQALMNPNASAAVRVPSGFAGYRRVARRGVGDLLSDATAALRNAGYAGATCRTERVSLPMPDPATGRAFYDQDVCSAPGYTGGFMAPLVVAAGQQRLQAERAALTAAGGGDDPSYFDGVGRSSQTLRTASPGDILTSLNQFDPLPPNRNNNTTAPGGGWSGVQNQLNTAMAPPVVTITNDSRPGGGMFVGDNWTITVKGLPNSTVEATAVQTTAAGSKDYGRNKFGTTDASGVFTLRGTFAPDTVGAWAETWFVQGHQAGGSINFPVSPKPVALPPSQDVNAGAGNGGAATATATSFDWLKDEMFGIPVWALGVGVIAAGFVFGGKR